MIQYKKGNILEEEADALVNTVNTYGVMGKGIALAFKKTFPKNYKDYRKAFENKELQTGKMFVHKTDLLIPKYIINFPTKRHWRNKSKLEYIEQGLEDLLNVIETNKIRSIAIPPLGCGNGGLDWKIVKKLIIDKLTSLQEETQIIIYEPGFSLNLRTVKPITRLTPTRAIYLRILRQYELLGEEITTLVVQKLAYLLQRIGEPLRLRFDKGIYGPYAPNLNKMLEAFNPHFIHYENDLNKPTTVIKLIQDKKEETKQIIDTQLNDTQKERLDKIQSLIEGFENSFGLELLATVAFAKEQCPNCSKEEIIADIQNWTKRKKELMSERLISLSYDRLESFNI